VRRAITNLRVLVELIVKGESRVYIDKIYALSGAVRARLLLGLLYGIVMLPFGVMRILNVLWDWGGQRYIYPVKTHEAKEVKL